MFMMGDGLASTNLKCNPAPLRRGFSLGFHMKFTAREIWDLVARYQSHPEVIAAVYEIARDERHAQRIINRPPSRRMLIRIASRAIALSEARVFHKIKKRRIYWGPGMIIRRQSGAISYSRDGKITIIYDPRDKTPGSNMIASVRPATPEPWFLNAIPH